MCSKLVARVNFMEHFNECSVKGGSDLWVLVNCSKCGEQVDAGLCPGAFRNCSHSLVQFTALDTQSLPHTLQVSKSHEAEHIAAGCSSFGRVVAADIGTPIGSIPPAVCEVTGALIDAELLEINVDLGATRLFIMHNKYPRL